MLLHQNCCHGSEFTASARKTRHRRRENCSHARTVGAPVTRWSCAGNVVRDVTPAASSQHQNNTTIPSEHQLYHPYIRTYITTKMQRCSFPSTPRNEQLFRVIISFYIVHIRVLCLVYRITNKTPMTSLIQLFNIRNVIRINERPKM